LTGGSGFIATHVLETLLARGHSVVTTVRSQQKAQAILDAHPQLSKDRLDCAIVEDMARADGRGSLSITYAFLKLTIDLAFDDAVVSELPFEAVIHTASPYHFHAKDAKELLEPGEHRIVGDLENRI
jgi:nucleoside-diphosphate-sugar epimerase